jgi:exopolyphosphatase/guanosine-5'-triphosphate,3'-diphosphate pyrophosphatase
VIAIDLGSNTLRAVEIDCTTHEMLKSYECAVKTADALHATGIISDAACTRVIEGLLEMRAVWDLSAHEVRAVTTAAMRKARNASEVLAVIEARTGVRFEIIDAQKEAYYTRVAVQRRLQLLGYDRPYVLIDIGGGSTELIYSDAHTFKTQSYEVGIVTFSQNYKEKFALKAAIHTHLAPVKAFLQTLPQRASLMVCTAGTPTTLAAFKQGLTMQNYDPQKINGTHLNVEEVRALQTRLMALSEDERIAYVGVGRAELIDTGIEILEALFALLGFSEALVIDDSLREGLAIDACTQNKEQQWQ